MLGGRSMQSWVSEYAKSHTHPINRTCHTFGIPMIAVSLPLIPLAFFGMWWAPVSLFVGGWTLQFIGHAYEGKPPEFLKDWRFLLVGLRWWFAKVAGRA
jgi:uncharacterized membrane protein YGL010W